MTDANLPALPGQDFAHAPGALDGVRTRRIFAWAIDAVIVLMFTWLFGLLMAVLSLFTFGLSFALAPLLAFVGIFYAGLTVSGRGMGTWGMQMLDLRATHRVGGRLDFIVAAGHALIFWLTLPVFALPSLVSLFNADKRTLHDFLAGVIVTRRG